MTRKRRGRSQGRQTQAPATERNVEPGGDVKPCAPVDGQPVRRFRALLAAELLLFMCLAGLCVVWRLRAPAPGWPHAGDVFGSVLRELAMFGLLAASCATMFLTTRSATSGKVPSVRGWAAATLLLGCLFLGLRINDYRVRFLRGVFPAASPRAIFDEPDVYYVQAVRFSLRQHVKRLESMRTQHPEQFTSEGAQRLDLVNVLLRDMVTWTEEEVGHWLEDLEMRIGLMRALAYQVHPLARDRDAVAAIIARERTDAAVKRVWFTVLERYCVTKSGILGEITALKQRPTTAPAVLDGMEGEHQVPGGSAADGEGGAPRSAASPAPELAAKSAEMSALDAKVREELAQRDCKRWPFADAVIHDTTDLAMAGERLNQVKFRLEAIDSRLTFLDEYFDPLVEQEKPRGLNDAHSWLRLPVSVPNGRTWSAARAALTLFHTGILLAGLSTLAIGIRRPLTAAHAGFWRRTAWHWYAITGAGAFVVLLLSP
ncbi:MAG: hypothetical protein FJ276_29780 [Planctomycetes bacterium]|nr:hypothetical protein [Planctomycetota bacterium]